MATVRFSKKSVPVMVAAAVLLLLAGSLAARYLSSTGRAKGARSAPAATVPEARPLEVSTLEFPCWGCPKSSRNWPIRFRTDLDLLAPLGDGPANAALYFADFAKHLGSRYDEAREAMDGRVDGPEWLGAVLPPDHPLLEEAAGWCDQATLRFYPDVFELKGYETRVPNLLFMLGLARSWVARAMAADDQASADADLRRAIRLGRLLRQEDVTVIADLVGLACIRAGAEGFYRLALERSDTDRALLAAMVLSEHAPQRLLTSERVTVGNFSAYGRIDGDGKARLELPDRVFDRLIEMATSAPERRFRGEPLIGLNIVLHLGTPEQQERARQILDELSRDPDEIVALGARWARDHKPRTELLEETFEIH